MTAVIKGWMDGWAPLKSSLSSGYQKLHFCMLECDCYKSVEQASTRYLPGLMMTTNKWKTEKNIKNFHIVQHEFLH